MIVNMSEKATEQEINHVIERIREAGYQPHITRGTERTIVAAVGSPAVRLTFDVAHVEMSDGNVLRHLEQFWPLIGAIQIADLPGRVELGAGRLDWPALLGAMRRRGWQGLLELEHMPAEESLAGEHRLVERLRALDALLD